MNRVLRKEVSQGFINIFSMQDWIPAESVWSTVLALLAGCGVSEENWSKKSAKASCDFSKRCLTTTFYATYVDMDDCRDQTEAGLDATLSELAMTLGAEVVPTENGGFRIQ